MTSDDYQRAFSRIAKTRLADRYLSSFLQKAELEASRRQVYLVVGAAVLPAVWGLLCGAWVKWCSAHAASTDSFVTELALSIQAGLLFLAGVCCVKVLLADWGLLFPRSDLIAKFLEQRIEFWSSEWKAAGGSREAYTDASLAVVHEETNGLLTNWAIVADTMRTENNKLLVWIRREVGLLSICMIVQISGFVSGLLPASYLNSTHA